MEPFAGLETRDSEQVGRLDDAARDLLAGCAILDGERLTTAFGHLSVRAPDDRVMVSGNLGPGLVRSLSDVVTVDLAGEVVGGDPALRPGELAIHLGLLAGRPDIMSVCRFHGPACLAWSTLGSPLPATIGMGLFVGASVPVYDTTGTVTTLAQGAELAAIVSGDAVLLRGFGAATRGRSVKEAVARAWFLEQSAAAALAASAAGTPHAFPPHVAAPFAAPEAPAAAQIDRLWHYLCRRWAAGDEED